MDKRNIAVKKKEIKNNLKQIGHGLIETEKRINLYINILLDYLPLKRKGKYVLCKKDIESQKNEDTPLVETIFFESDSSSTAGAFLPQEILFYLIDSFLLLCRYSMELCLIQQQIYDICYEEDYSLKTRGELLFIKNLINEKMSELKEEMNILFRKTDDISTTQIELNFRQNEDNKRIERQIKENKKQEGRNAKELKETFVAQKNFKATTQIILAKLIRSGIAKYCWKNRRTIKERIREGLKLPNLPTLIKLFNHWNSYLRASSEKRKEMTDFEPYQKYTEILYAQEETVKNWGEQTFAPTYIKKWVARKKEKEERRKKKRNDGKERPDALDRLTVGGDDGEMAMDNLIAEKSEVDSSVFFDDPRPKKRRFKSS